MPEGDRSWMREPDRRFIRDAAVAIGFAAVG
jgi:hypothetical protein